MPIVVRHSPAAAVVAQGAYLGGLEELRRQRQREALQAAELAQRAAEVQGRASDAEASRQAAMDEAEQQRQFLADRDRAQAGYRAEETAAETQRALDVAGLTIDRTEAAKRADFERMTEKERLAEAERVAAEGRRQRAEMEKGLVGNLNFDGQRRYGPIREKIYKVENDPTLTEEQRQQALGPLLEEKQDLLDDPTYQADRLNPQKAIDERVGTKVIGGQEYPFYIDEKGIPHVIEGVKMPDPNKQAKIDADRQAKVDALAQKRLEATLKLSTERAMLEAKMAAGAELGKGVSEQERQRIMADFDARAKQAIDAFSAAMNPAPAEDVPPPSELAPPPPPPETMGDMRRAERALGGDRPLKLSQMDADMARWYRSRTNSAEEARALAAEEGWER